MDGRLVLVFSLDSLVPITSLALLPVELSSFEGLTRVDSRGNGDSRDSFNEDDDNSKQQLVDSSQVKGRYPFSHPPLPPPAPVSRDGEPPPPPHKSYMLMVGYNQVG